MRMPLTDLLRPRRNFPIPPFELPPLEFEAEDELLLDSIVESIGPVAPASEILPAATAGELRDRIETHLRVAGERQPETDAAEELRLALAQLRRSLG